jgi:hypothetical protein
VEDVYVEWGTFAMDDWKSRGLKPWMLRVEVGLLISVVLVIVGLIRLRGHNPEGGYDVHNVRDETEANAAKLY